MKTDINVFIALYILFYHWIADFVFQNDWMALGKSKAMKPLLAHTSVYSTIMMFGLSMLYLVANSQSRETPAVWTIFAFGGITFVFHTIQDYITSRINARLHFENKIHEFFVSIGLDQTLHFIQLLLTYQLLTS